MSRNAAVALLVTDSGLAPRLLRSRIESIDVLRGLLMVLMALDHTRDFFTYLTIDPANPLQSWPVLFATRWVTHLCAPGFVFLAGVSIYLQRSRGKTIRQLQTFLVTRGLWLAFFDLTVTGHALSFSMPPALFFGAIWVSGLSMVVLAPLLSLSTRWIGLVGVAILVLHNLLDHVQAASFGSGALLWDALHEQAIVHIHGYVLLVLYPLVPWIGIICVGYAFGPLVAAAPARRQCIAAWLGACLLTAFAILRFSHAYGNHKAFHRYPGAAQTVMSFFDVEKYPPSLHYVLATLGFLLLLFAALDLAVTRDAVPRLRGFLDVYGRVPLFYWAVHLYLLHLTALVFTVAEHLDWCQWFMPAALLFHHIPGWGFGLPGVYCAWIGIVLAMYVPCVWFAGVKAHRRDWWLAYL